MKTCANPPCSRRFKPKRPHQRFCSSDCRREAWAAEQVKAPENAFSQGRRASRDGKGARVYLTEGELNFLARAVAHYEPASSSALGRLFDKLQRAGYRIHQKEST